MAKKIEQTETKKMGRRSVWTEDKVEKICNAIAQGKSHKDAMFIANVPKSTFYEHLAEDAYFADRVKKAEAEYQQWYDTQLVGECKRSLIELVCGYEWDETTTESTTDKNGKSVIVKTKVVHKKAAPNPTAIIFALCNRDPENWKNRINNEVSGKIETENKPGITLSNVPDELLSQVIDAIHGK